LKILLFGNLAAAYEMDDFVAIAGLNGGIGPLRAREDFEIAFDGDATGEKIQVAQQVGYCGALWGFAALSIDSDYLGRIHSLILPYGVILLRSWLLAAKLAGGVARLSDWNALANTQFETQLSFGWATCGFDYQGGAGIA
jgi:hypothetical protein